MSKQENSDRTDAGTGGATSIIHILEQHLVGRSIFLPQWALKEVYPGQKAGATCLSINGPTHLQGEWVITGKVIGCIKEIWIPLVEGSEGFMIRVEIAGEEKTFPVHPYDMLFYA